MIRRAMLPGGMMLGAVAVAKVEESTKNELICKPSSLPIYSDFVSDKHVMAGEHKSSKVAQTIEGGVKVVREEVMKVSNMYDAQKTQLDKYYVDFLKDTQHVRNYLQMEENTFPRIGAIALGGLGGVVLGVRSGGFFRKLFYGTITGSAVAAVCYPREGKKYALIAYNFAYGIKPGDERQKDLPKFPTTFGELKDNVVSLSSLAYDSVFNSKK